MTGRLEGKNAIVIGAGSVGPGWGNGKAASVLFAREGARVACVDVNREAAEETAGIIAREGGEAIVFQANASDTDQVRAVIEGTIARFGSLDVLNNNVGIVDVGGVVETSEERWSHVMRTNLDSCFLAMKHAIPHMVANGGGSIINISSIASIRYTGVPYASYSASKAAMNHLTRTTAVEYAASNVRVNAILPGLMKTPMVEHSAGLASGYANGDVDEMWKKRAAQVPMGKMGDAWDVAHAALFLASDEARYITGIELLVDGGITAKIN